MNKIKWHFTKYEFNKRYFSRYLRTNKENIKDNIAFIICIVSIYLAFVC